MTLLHYFQLQAISASVKMDGKFDLKLIPEFDRSTLDLVRVEWIEKAICLQDVHHKGIFAVYQQLMKRR